MSSEPFFEPYVGADYSTDPFGGRRLLIVGESHYNEEPDEPYGPGDTRLVIDNHVKWGKSGFYKYVQDCTSGYTDELSREAFWRRVAFCNFVQEPMANAQARPDEDHYRVGLQSFWTTLGRLNPEIVFFFSRNAWGYLPADYPNGGSGRTLCASEWIWRYQPPGGAPLYCVSFKHRNARSNIPVDVWKAWADHARQVIAADMA